MAGRASAQIPEPPRPTCVNEPGAPCRGGGASSTESVEERNARWAAIAEARREAKAERDAEKAKRKAEKDAQKLKDEQDKQKKQDEARQKAEADRQEAEAEQLRQLNAQREREAEAARQRQLAIEAQRLQAAFDTIKPDAVGALKGVEGDSADASGADGGLNLKGVDDAPRAVSQAAWTAAITDPVVAPFARRLDHFVPPPPITEKEVALDWKKIYLNDNRLLNTGDYVIAGWEMAGLIGGSTIYGKFLMIGAKVGVKTLLAGQDGAYMYLVRKDKDYDAALAYLKSNKEQAQTFAHLIDDVRQHRPLPASADPSMVKVAQAINDTRHGNSNWGITWDVMTSQEALSAMIRKASIEAASELASFGVGTLTNGMFSSQKERKEMFDLIRQDRSGIRKIMDQPTTTLEQRAHFKMLIDLCDQDSAKIYKWDAAAKRVKEGMEGIAIGKAADNIADILLGPETKAHEF